MPLMFDQSNETSEVKKEAVNSPMEEMNPESEGGKQ